MRSKSVVAKVAAVGAAIGASTFVIAYAVAENDDTEPTPATTMVAYPTAVEDARPLSVEGHPQAEYLSDDPDGQQVRSMYETGWTPARPLEGGGSSFVQTRAMTNSDDGDVLQVVDAEMNLVAYWIVPGLYVPRSEFEARDFEWREFVRSNPEFPDGSGERLIERIEAAGGVSSEIQELAP